MRRQIIQYLGNYAPDHDAIEILTVAASVLFVVTIAFVF